MHFYKKIMTVLLSNLYFILVFSAPEVIDYSSGYTSLMSMVGNDETGVMAYNKKYLHPAQSQNLVKDLDIPEMVKFFNCTTEVGQAFLFDALSKPLSPQDAESILKNRQNSIQALVDNPDIKEYAERLLELAKAHEQNVIQLLSDFFIGKYCSAFKVIEEQKAKKVWGVSFAEFFYSSPTMLTLNAASLMCMWAGALALTRFSYKEIERLKKNREFIPVFLRNTMWESGITSVALSGVLVFYYNWTRDQRNKIHDVNRLVEIAEDIEHVYEKLGLTSQFKVSEVAHSEGRELINSLRHARYQEKNTYFFMPPMVQALLYNLYKSKNHLAPIFASIAELDAYNALATKIIESKKSDNQFCFVTHTQAPYPHITMKGFWNVLIKNPVANTINEDRSLILTGPNAGGKTTAIRSILQNIVLSQTFGIAAAQECALPMFDVIHSYLNISDDYVSGLSLFACEVKRAQHILECLKTLKPGQKFFFGLDELFTGTNADDGETCAYEFVKRLAEFNNAQFIYATHFNKMKELASESEFCTNYKVDAPTKNEAGRLVYPFTLSPGASDSRVALDIAQHAGLFA